MKLGLPKAFLILALLLCALGTFQPLSARGAITSGLEKFVDYVVPSSTQTIEVNGLDLAADKTYLILFEFKNGYGSAQTYHIYFNEITTGYATQQMYSSGSSTASGAITGSRYTYAYANGRCTNEGWIMRSPDNYTMTMSRTFIYTGSAPAIFFHNVYWANTENPTKLWIQAEYYPGIAAGSHLMMFRVVDEAGGEALSPVARFTNTISKVNPNQTMSFDGSMSFDPDGGSLTDYSWDFGDGNVTSGTYPTISHKWNVTGNYLLNLTVTDDESAQDSFAWALNVTEYIEPIAKFTFSPSNPSISQTVYFNASESSDPDGYITDYFWSFGDGENATGITTSHSYSSSATYVVNLTVTDDKNLTDSFSQNIKVSGPPPEPIIGVTFVAAKVFDLTALVKDQYRYPIENAEVKIYIDSKLVLEGKTDEYGAFIAKRQSAGKKYKVVVTYDMRDQQQIVVLSEDKTLVFEYSLFSFDVGWRMLERNWLLIALLLVIGVAVAVKWKRGWGSVLVIASCATIFYTDYTMLPIQYKLFSVILVVGVCSVIAWSFGKKG